MPARKGRMIQQVDLRQQKALSKRIQLIFKERDPSLLSNLKESYALTEVILRAPWWALDDVWPKRHVYFVRHLRLCDLAKKRLLQRRILRIGHYFVQKAWVDYRLPMVWHEKLRIKR